ncbi:alpha/beta-hydrolase [Dendrothele bispora CBS 962.96]|uniref:Alpha/beta-hydrolase n=1 Tax=Dendrothele bispora (strain CBS 962.96) TaxID=1314807 RepID=A0A4S8L2Q1_DENBC|nr:alpha/beta-hydrolase [Dendrothele bispora CBS 962.96]
MGSTKTHLSAILTPERRRSDVYDRRVSPAGVLLGIGLSIVLLLASRAFNAVFLSDFVSFKPYGRLSSDLSSADPWSFAANLTTEQLKDLEPGTVVWGPCVPEADDNIDCGSIVVPKDYFDPTVGNAVIALAKWKASKSPKKGTIFLNPGGPGGAGTRMVSTKARGEAMTKLLGDDYDLIGFDPRGIGHTIPATKCFPSPEINTLFFANTVIEQGITVSSISNLSSPFLYDRLVEQHRQFIAIKQAQAELCRQNMGDELKYMGTATVVRDMDFMTKVFDGEDAKINYFGGSYGSILGAYLVNMLPERIGYAAIDGIADPVNWSNEPSHKWPHNWVYHSEKTYEIFLKGCSEAGPTICPLTKFKGEPWKNIERRFEEFFDLLALEPLPVFDGDRPGFLTSGAARALLQITLQRPSLWVSFAESFASAFAGNGTSLYTLLGQRNILTADLTRLAVTCLDSPANRTFPPTAEELTEQGLKNLEEVSVHFGLSTGVSEPDGGCEYWPVEGPERFVGPWNASNLENPLLIISNTADPITPISSGLLINSLMPKSSTMIIQNGPGHCSSALPSLCTIKTVRSFFAGEIPKNGTWCEVDVSPFPSDDEDHLVRMMSEEDRALIDAMFTIGNSMAEARGEVLVL